MKYLRTRTRACSPADGFTLIEVIVIVVVISILAAIIVSSNLGYMQRSRDVQRANSVASIARILERYYRTNATVSGPTYPTTALGAAGVATIIDDSSLTNAPGQTTNSVVMATSNATQTPTIDQYIYQPLTSAGALCGTAPCVKYKLYYRQEVDQVVVTVDSSRQQ